MSAVHWVPIFYLQEMFDRDVDKRPLGDLLANTVASASAFRNPMTSASDTSGSLQLPALKSLGDLAEAAALQIERWAYHFSRQIVRDANNLSEVAGRFRKQSAKPNTKHIAQHQNKMSIEIVTENDRLQIMGSPEGA